MMTCCIVTEQIFHIAAIAPHTNGWHHFTMISRTILLTIFVALLAILKAEEPAPYEGNEMRTRAFMITIMTLCFPHADKAETAVKSLVRDGLEDSEQTRAYNARPYIEALGVEFPPGASALYGLSGSILIVTNTKENIKKIADIVLKRNAELWGRMIRIEVRVVEFPPEMEEQLNAKSTFQSLEKNLGPALKTLCVSSVVTKSGNRAQSQADGAHTNSLGTKKPSKDEGWPPPIGAERALLEVEPVVGPDGKCVDMQIAFHYASKTIPTRLELTTNITVEDGRIFKVKTFTINDAKTPANPPRRCAVLVGCQLVDQRGRITEDLRDEFLKEIKRQQSQQSK